MKILSLILALVAISTFASAQSSYTYSSESNSTYGDATYAPYTNNYVQVSDDDDVVVNEVLVGTTDANDTDQRDSFRAGRAFASGALWRKLNWNLNYRDVNGSRHHMITTSDPGGIMNTVTLDGKVIIAESDGSTLPGVPVPFGGMRDVTVYVSGVDHQEIPRVVGHGQFDRVDANHPITIELLPEYVEKRVPYDISKMDLPEGFDPSNLRLVLEDGTWVGYYQSWSEGFVMWTDPSLKPFYVTIMTDNGIRYGSFQIDPLKQNQKPFQGSSVNVQLAGNVHRFNLKDTDGHFSDYAVSEINGNIENKEGKNRKAKVFIVENKWRMPLDFSMYGVVNGQSARMKISAYFVYPEHMEEAGEIQLSPSKYGNTYEIAGTLSVEPYSDESASMMFVVEVLAGEPVGDFNFHLSQFHNGNQPVYDGEVKISEFVDLGSRESNEEGTYRDYTFSVEITAVGGDVRVFADELMTFVEGSGTASRIGVMDSTAEEISSGVYVVQENETEVFTISVNVYNVSQSGQYRVGLESIGGVKVDKTKYRTLYSTINRQSGGEKG